MNSSSSVNHLENKNQFKPNSFIAVCSCVKGFNVAFMVQRGEQREALKVKSALSAFFFSVMPQMKWERWWASLVMTGRHVKLFEEYVCIAKVAVGPPLSRPIPKLLSNEKALSNKKGACYSYLKEWVKHHNNTGQAPKQASKSVVSTSAPTFSCAATAFSKSPSR